ncbi:hypothetical protein BB561_003169 [Smittium simulii]|uniref:PCI domain-containing protein n=1 Tax=Smittium simulii TaxID=133385 RepID=A0A2T9YMQ8_9FUNG|nr:hypothetical protein BB561_003169 [Smittium simulii]
MVELSSKTAADADSTPKDSSLLLFYHYLELERCLNLIAKGVAQSETTYIQRALKELPYLRKSIDCAQLAKVIAHLNLNGIYYLLFTIYYSSFTIHHLLFTIHYSPFTIHHSLFKLKKYSFCNLAIGYEKWKDSFEFSIKAIGIPQDSSPSVSSFTFYPESALFVLILVLTHFLDTQQLEKGTHLSHKILPLLPSHYRRTLDSLSAQFYFFYSRFYELTNQSQECRKLLLSALQNAMLNKSTESLATIINLLLRNYIQAKLYNQASKLAMRTVFPENASNNQIARYFFYMGCLEAIELNYSISNQHLQDASRKVPINSSTAGFQQSVHKYLVIVSLLMGEIPERSLFKNRYLKRSLAPYLELVLAVRSGELATFQQVVSKNKERFLKDNLMLLILRLRHNVIKVGIRSICLSYKRISLRDICIKLHLDSEEDAEYIISKAIKDGVVDAVIDHENGFIQTNELIDAYSTSKPQDMFNQRIGFCLNLYNSQS